MLGKDLQGNFDMKESITQRLKSKIPDVSVIIVNWNTRDLLQQALESLYQETHDITFETIVIDNASRDGTTDYIQKEWQQVKIIALHENLGFGVANNIGFKESSGRYILVLNSDTIVLPSTLSGMVGFLDTHPKAGCVGCRHLNPDGTLQGSMDSFPSLFKDFLCFSDMYRIPVLQPFLQKKYPYWSNHDKICKVDWVNGSCMMVRCEVIEEVGGFDNGCFMYAEELDWCYRMKNAGWEVFFTPESEIIHIGGQSSKKIADKRITLLYKGHYRFYRRNYSMWKYLVLRIIVAVIANPRLFILSFFYLLSLLGVKPRIKQWEILTQESVVTEPIIMLRAWWNIFFLPWKI